MRKRWWLVAAVVAAVAVERVIGVIDAVLIDLAEGER